MGERREFIAVTTEAAERVAAVLAGNPLRARQPYPITEVLRAVAECHDTTWRAVAALPIPVTVDADGREDQFGVDVAGLVSHLQLLLVLFHGLDDIPDQMRVAANRSLSAAHLIARRVRDGGRRLSRAR